MEFTLDINAPSPLYRQIQEQVRYAISVGELVPGDALPSIRQLESRLDVNRNTVRRAYVELQAQGVLVLRQGREAVIAAPPPMAESTQPKALGDVAAELTALMLRRAESNGLDSLQLAEFVARAAREHDTSYPKCAFVECSAKQADDFARDAERHLGRRVIGVDLHDLKDGPHALPPSVRFVLTPHWHAAETRDLMGSPRRPVVAVGVRVAAACTGRLRELAGTPVGLVVRDPESVPGYRKRIRSAIRRGAIKVALAGAPDQVAAMMKHVAHVVYTSPCAEVVRRLAPATVETIEIEFESAPADLEAVPASFFPAPAAPTPSLPATSAPERAPRTTGDEACEAPLSSR